MRKYFIIFLILLFPFNTCASSKIIIMDTDSGRVLYEKSSHEKQLIASITKIMTCLITLENTNLDKKVIVSNEVNDMYGTNIYIEENEILTVRDLLYGLMLRSGNDAAVVLAKNVFKSDVVFIKKMNEKAQELGMKNTSFQNPHGLDDKTKNYSTAYDMAILSRYAHKNKEYQKIVSTKKYSLTTNIKSYTWYNRMNLLNNYRYCTGGKNGYTPKAGKTLVTTASKNNTNLTIVSLDDPNIYQNHQNLYEEYFNKYKKYLIIDKNNFNINSSFITKEVYIKKSFSYTLNEKELEDVKTIIKIFPKRKDKVVGTIIIKLKDIDIGKISIYEKKK